MTWVEFHSCLQEIRHRVQDISALPPSTALSEKYRSAIENLKGEGARKGLPRAQEAWKQLRTAKNRHAAVQLLLAAFVDVVQEIVAESSLRQRAAAKRRAQYTALKKARSKARTIGRQWIAALAAYQRTTEAVDHWLGLPRLAAAAPELFREQEEEVRKKEQEVRDYVTAATALVEQLHQMTNYAP